MGHNELRALPEGLAANTRLKIVDIGGCPVQTISAIQVSAVLPFPVHPIHPTPFSPSPGHAGPCLCARSVCVLAEAATSPEQHYQAGLARD